MNLSKKENYDERDPWTYCWWCGARLKGGLTEHEPECWILELLKKTYKEKEGE